MKFNWRIFAVFDQLNVLVWHEHLGVVLAHVKFYNFQQPIYYNSVPDSCLNHLLLWVKSDNQALVWPYCTSTQIKSYS